MNLFIMDNLHLIQLNQYERPTITEERNRDWVSIGDNNDYYQNLINCYMDSTTNQAVINGIVNQVYGKGLEATDANQKPEQYAQMKSLIKNDCLRKVCQDLKLLGEASFQITYTGNRISSITHFPRETLRAEKMNGGEVKNYFYAPDWTKVNRNTKLKKFPVFGSGSQNEIYIIKRYVTGFYYYSPADYNTAYATLENEIACYLINDTVNGFSGTKVVNFNNGVPDREKQIAIKNDVMNKLTGSYGEKVIIAFNNGAESKTTVDDIPLNDAPSHYEFLSQECARKIMLTHRVTSPLLIGLREGNNGLGNNADEIENASRLFNNVVIQPYQNLLTDCISEILAVNNISLNLYFKTIEPLEFMDLENVQNDDEEEEQTGIKEDDPTELEMCLAESKDYPNEFYDEVLNVLQGEKVDTDEWEMVDVRDWNEENNSDEEWANELIELAKGGNYDGGNIEYDDSKNSNLDKSFYMVRYKYAVGSRKKRKTGKTRPFCENMMFRTRQGIVYRLEDIDNASRKMDFKAAKLPMHKGQKYDLFRFKGGVFCRHKWQQVLYKLKQPLIDSKTKSDDIKDHKKVNSIPPSYEPKPRGRQDSIKAPVNMPNNGHHPNWSAPKKKKK